MNDSSRGLPLDLSPARLLRDRPTGLTVLGAPRAGRDDRRRDAVEFDGSADALIVSGLGPIAGLAAFSVSVRFRPARDGAFEQRFFHIQADGSDDRFLLEIRLAPDGTWCADTFFSFGGRTALLQYPDLRHPADEWATYQASYDGRMLRHAIDGTPEPPQPFPGAALPVEGVVSIGIRATIEYPFRGAISTVTIDGPVAADS